jgi:toxin ParE1/3/4
VKVVLGDGAKEDLAKGVAFYRREAGAGLSLSFASEFRRSAELLIAYPALGAIWRGAVRRLPLRRFPYSIVYRVKADEIQIFAVAHQRRKPGYWRERG